jgi:hypothetical protein
MIVTRTIAGLVVTLLLAVTSMAAACDLSCAFALANSDCHPQDATSQSSADSSVAMDGMDMPGMAMPGMTPIANHPSISDISQARVGHHPSIGTMGPCERQSCDKSSFGSVKTNRVRASRPTVVLPIAQNPRGDTARSHSYDARDDVASDPPSYRNSFQLSLRI